MLLHLLHLWAHTQAQLTLSTVPSALGGRQAAPMGPTTEVASPPTATSAEVPQPLHAPSAPQGNDHLLGSGHNLRFADWLYRSSAASVIWLAVRLVLGYWWLNAGLPEDLGQRESVLLVWRRSRGEGIRHGRSRRIDRRQRWRQLRLVGRLPAQLRRPERLVDRANSSPSVRWQSVSR